LASAFLYASTERRNIMVEPRRGRADGVARTDAGDFPGNVGSDETVAQHVNETEIARRAYQLYESRGGEHGRDWDDWFRAEQELRGGEPQPSNDYVS
jgi:hypothetical protein